MKDLLLYLAQSLVDDPSSVVINEKESDNSTVFEVKVAADDMGKIIGKQGKNAQAIRTIMKAASSKENKRVIVEIV